jgi:hypothetical protein
MPYTIQGKVKYVQQLTPVEDRKWNEFVNNLRTMNPRDAAEATGTRSSVQYKATGNQIQFRIGGGKRVSFVLDGTNLKQVQVGGHS